MEGKRQPGYEIRFEKNPRRVRVEFNRTSVADSTRVLVLHETRLPPMYYFPREDVRLELLARTEHRTHCPFKGDASYWTLRVDDAVAENAAWSYEEPYDDAAPIRQYLAFYPSRVSAIYDGEDEAPHLDRGASMHANAIAGWLLAEAWKAATPEELMAGFCRCLQEARFKDSPFALILRGAGGVRRRMERPEVKLDFPVVRDLKAEGASDYVAMPFRFSDGQMNVMSMTSFAAGGFSTDHLGRIFEILPGLARYFEVYAQRRTAVTLLKTYLGHHTGDRVLAGQVKLGDGEHIHSVVWFSDLRESTMLSKSMAQDAYLAHLNRYFDCMAGAVMEKGGEVLRFIGDAVLAIFPIAEASGRHWASASGAAEACRRAIDAATIACERIAAANRSNPQATPIGFGIGLHLGDVTYGNIGVRERLEFTVIGASANEAARVESMSKTLKQPVVISAAFARTYPGKLVPLGRHALKDVAGEQELFTLP